MDCRSWESFYEGDWTLVKTCWMHRILIENDVDTEERL